MSVTDDRGNVTHTVWTKIRFVIHCSRRQVFVWCANMCTKDVGRLWNIVASAMLRRLRTGPRPTEQQVLLKSFTHVCVLNEYFHTHNIIGLDYGQKRKRKSRSKSSQICPPVQRDRTSGVSEIQTNATVSSGSGGVQDTNTSPEPNSYKYNV